MDLVNLEPYTIYTAELKAVNAYGETSEQPKVFLTKSPALDLGYGPGYEDIDKVVEAKENTTVNLQCYQYVNDNSISWSEIDHKRPYEMRMPNRGSTLTVDATKNNNFTVYQCWKVFEYANDLKSILGFQILLVVK